MIGSEALCAVQWRKKKPLRLLKGCSENSKTMEGDRSAERCSVTSSEVAETHPICQARPLNSEVKEVDLVCMSLESERSVKQQDKRMIIWLVSPAGLRKQTIPRIR
jgi:hypothetical protein